MSIRTLFRAGAVLGAVAGIGIVVYAATAITATTTTANVTAGANNQTFVSATTTANVTAGANNQTFVSATTTANVSQTKASLTLTVNSIPGYNASTTIGSCVVSYSTTSASSYNCSGNAATINTVTSNTVALLTTALASLTNVGSASHGALAVTATTTNTVTFSTAGTETSATSIPFVDGTSNAVSSSASVNGVVPAAQVNTFTLGGTAESGDTYSLLLPTGTLSYLTVASDTSATNIAIDINATLQATSSYASLPYTSSASGSTVVLTAKTAGTGFTAPAPSVTNRPGVAQVNTFTLGGTAESGDTYSLLLPTGTLSYLTVASDTSATNIAIDINATLQATSSYASLPYTSSASGSTVVLTAKTAGTGFTAPAPSVTNRPGVAQVTAFSIPSITNTSTYGITINSNTYNFTGNTTGAVVSGLQAAMAGDPAVACTVSGSTITCTARVAGTPFSYSTSGIDVVSSSGSSGGGGSVKDQVAWLIANGNTKAAQAIEAQWPQLFGRSSLHSAASPGTNSGFTRNLSVGKRGVDVKALQIFLNAHGAPIAVTGSGSAGHETTLFGASTKRALAKYQKEHGLTPATGFFGPITRAYIENHP